jgi:hypothetical protein
LCVVVHGTEKEQYPAANTSTNDRTSATCAVNVTAAITLQSEAP